MLESVVFIQEDFLEIRNFSNQVFLDKESVYFGDLDLNVAVGNIEVLATDSKNGVVAKLFHQDETEPNLLFSGFDAVLKAAGAEDYDPRKINIYIFSCIRRNAVILCEWNRITADLI